MKIELLETLIKLAIYEGLVTKQVIIECYFTRRRRIWANSEIGSCIDRMVDEKKIGQNSKGALYLFNGLA